MTKAILLIGVVVFVALGSSATTFFVLNNQKPKQPEPLVVVQSPTPTSTPPSVLAAQTASAAKKLIYSLPPSWNIIQDKTTSFEVGYNPQEVSATAENKRVQFAYLKHPGSFRVSLEVYNGGSRHQFIYNQLGITNPAQDKMSDYREKEYSYNGMSCLVLYGLAYSASGTTWGMCAIDSAQAFFIAGPGDESKTEELIQTILMK